MMPSASPQLHNAIVDLFHDTVSRFPPTHAPNIVSPFSTHHRVGDYLLELGYVLPREFNRALHSWQHQATSRPLGCWLVTHDLVPAPVLASVLLLQSLDYFEHPPFQQPRFLGERLLIEGDLTPYQLAAVLQEQLTLYQCGKWVTVGKLIAEHGWLDPVLINQKAVLHA